MHPLSYRTTERPCRAAAAPTAMPQGPAPTTVMSRGSVIYVYG